MRTTIINRRHVAVLTLAGMAIAGGIVILAGSSGQENHFLVSDSSKIATLSSAQRAFVSGVILDAQENSRAVSTAREEIKPAPALTSFGRTISAIRTRYPATFLKTDASTAIQRVGNLYYGRQAVLEKAKLLAVLKNAEAIQEVKPSQYPVLDMDSGVSGVQINRTVQQKGTLTITGKALQWAVMGQVQPSGSIAWAEPENTMIIKAHLTRVDGRWKIDTLSRSFAPGSEP